MLVPLHYILNIHTMPYHYPSRRAKYTKPAYKASKTPINPTIPAGFEQVYKDLLAYNGTFDLILNIRSAINRHGKLSDKQWAAVKKCLAPQPVQDPSLILVDKCSIPIVVSPSAARYIAKTHKWPLNPCTLTVTQIKSQDRRTYTLIVKMDWSSSVSMCRCCGKTLTDWRSQATGVGPYCVKNTNIQYVRNKSDVARFQKEMEDLCTKIGEVEVVVKKGHIRTGATELSNAISTATPVKLDYNIPDTFEITLNYCDWYERERKLVLRKSLVPQVDNNTKAVIVYNPSTNKKVKFIKSRLLVSDDKLTFLSTELDNPITLYITK